ncbi:hypothetical protein [Rhizobium etli]|uniref:hypothetical protein n=1 Tax=Rhizobium etli TaxID=29449 RepID=UPI0002DFAD91|nr:hypothetical protein [Rhizobium etli]
MFKRTLTLAVLLGTIVVGTARADDSWDRYRLITKHFGYMEGCNYMGQSPMTAQFMEKLHQKINQFEASHGFKTADIDALFEVNKADTLNVMQTGWLDGPQCYKTGELLSAKLKDDVFWQ